MALNSTKQTVPRLRVRVQHPELVSFVREDSMSCAVVETLARAWTKATGSIDKKVSSAVPAVLDELLGKKALAPESLLAQASASFKRIFRGFCFAFFLFIYKGFSPCAPVHFLFQTSFLLGTSVRFVVECSETGELRKVRSGHSLQPRGEWGFRSSCEKRSLTLLLHGLNVPGG